MNRSKAKGTRFESEVVGFLRGHGFPHAERRTLSGAHDKGDIAGVRIGSVGFCLEVKNCKAMALAEWIKEAQVEAINAGTDFFAVIHKSVRRPTGKAYVTLPLDVFCELLAKVPSYDES